MLPVADGGPVIGGRRATGLVYARLVVAERTAWAAGAAALSLDDVGRPPVVWWGMATNAQKAQEFLDLHHRGRPVVLPTAWDVWSAKLVEAAGFEALTIGSHPVSDSLGYQDGEGLPFDMLLEATARIAAGVEIPVSVDVESGYDIEPGELVRRVLEAGAVGINVEDTVHGEGRVRERDEHAEYIGALRQAADAAGVDLVVNARTDALLHGRERFTDPLAEAVQRMQACERAGARSLYPVRIPDRASLDTLLSELSLPVNVTAHPVDGAPSGSLAELVSAGVRRITFGPLLQQALTSHVQALAKPWATPG